MLKTTVGIQNELTGLAVAYGKQRFLAVANRYGIVDRREAVLALQDKLVNLDNVMYEARQSGRDVGEIEDDTYLTASRYETEILYINQSRKRFFYATSPAEPIRQTVVKAVAEAL